MMGSATVADDHATNDETYHHPFLPQMKKNILPQMMRRAIIRHMPQWQIIMPQMMRHATVADNHATNDGGVAVIHAGGQFRAPLHESEHAIRT